MARYTIELWEIVESSFDLGMDTEDYPIFDEDYRAGLNSKILDHYYYYEIGTETPGRFKHVLNRTLREVMPYYNQLYASALLPLQPLRDYDITHESDRTVTQDGTHVLDGENTQTDDSISVSSDTPQNLLSVADIRSNLYASQAERQDNTVNNNTLQTNTTNNTNVDEYAAHIFGNNANSQSKLLMEYRKTFLNIDMQVIESLAKCFMQIF